MFLLDDAGDIVYICSGSTFDFIAFIYADMVWVLIIVDILHYALLWLSLYYVYHSTYV